MAGMNKNQLKLFQGRLDDLLRRNSSMRQESQNARNHYSRPRGNMGVLHRRNK